MPARALVECRIMADWNLNHELIKAILSTSSAAVVLALTWLVGQRLTYEWNVRQKRREIQLAASQQFYAAYGEFFAVWKLWNRLDRDAASADERQWELHRRAAAAEAIVEGTLVKLSSELVLDEGQIGSLGRFRQAFQQLRQSIRKDQILPWKNSECPEYRAFKSHAIEVSTLLGGKWSTHPVPVDRAIHQLLSVTSNRWEDDWVVHHSPRP